MLQSDYRINLPVLHKTGGGYFFPYGDYLEFAVDRNGKNYVIWGEGSSYDGPGGTWFTRGK